MMFRKPPSIPTTAEALPGRAERMAVPETHFVNGTSTRAAFPGRARACDVRDGLLLGSRTQVLAVERRLLDRCRVRGRPDTEPDVSRSVHRHDRAHRGGARRVRPKVIRYDDLLQTFWESHDPTQGMRQGNDVGTQYRSGIYYYDDAQRLAAEPAPAMRISRDCRRPDTARLRPRFSRARVLLRRGVSPAVPGEEPRRLLRARRHRRELPGWDLRLDNDSSVYRFCSSS